MPKQNVSLQAFNRGVISPLALARTDIEKLHLSAETMTNWMPRVLGSMMLRPGTKYLGATYTNLAARFIPFVFATNDVALVEFTANDIRVWVNETPITRNTVSTAFTNGAFSGNITNWTDASDVGASVGYEAPDFAGGGGGFAYLIGSGTATAKLRQTLTIAVADRGVAHGVKIRVDDNFSNTRINRSVGFRIGSTLGGDNYITSTILDPGIHSLEFTPTGASAYVEFYNLDNSYARIRTIEIESGVLLIMPKTGFLFDLDNIRYSQSGDILFCTDGSQLQFKIERRGTNSWSAVKYLSKDGPFLPINTSLTTMTVSALSYTATVTASTPVFNSNHIEGLIRITSTGQTVTASLVAENTFTGTILVTGSGTHRAFTITRSGTWTATITLQRSLTSSSGSWEDVTTYTTNDTISYNDALDNQDVYYRIGIKTGGYTSGTAVLTLTYAFGGITGIGRITKYVSTTSVTIETLVQFGNTSASTDWYIGEWTLDNGFPSSIAFADGRLFWSGKNKIWGSVSDSYYSFDDSIEGDSGTINRSIGFGPVDSINWLLSLQRLLIGSQGNEIVCKASSFDEPLTPTAFTLRQASSQGSVNVSPVSLDRSGIFVQRGGTRIMEISMQQDGEYGTTDLNLLNPEICQPSVVRIAIQRQPDTRIHCVKSDGTVAILIFDKAENVTCWTNYTTDGTVEDVVVLPAATGNEEDYVYYVVNRTINGSTVRYLEKWAFESVCQGGTLNYQADCYLSYSGASSATITGLSHLEGASVIVWANGKSLGTYTVASGSIAVSEAVTTAVVGLTYTAQWKSVKLAYASGLGTALTQKKKLNHLGVILKNTHYQGLSYGPDFTTMDNLPLMVKGAPVAVDSIHSTFDNEAFEFPGRWDTDSRLCLQAVAPKPCTVLAAVISVETHDKY